MRPLLIVFTLALVAFAGCVGDETAPEQEPTRVTSPAGEGDLGARPENVTLTPPVEGIVAASPHVVVAGVDTGINPYNLEFRDHSPEAYVHPSNYLPGYPADTPALFLNLDEPDYTKAVLSDCDVWQNVNRSTMYWIPGTRIVGAVALSQNSDDIPCSEDQLPGVILDRGGHGTMISSRVAGETYSMCPDCKIVFVQGFSATNIRWAAQQPWIDLQTNSWGDLPTSWLVDRAGFENPLIGGNSRDVIIAAAQQHPVFVAGGNGLAGFFGVTGHPGYFDNVAGPQGIIMVGGHDNGMYAPWTMTMPHVVADANAHPGAEHEVVDRGTPTSGGGTSGATPFTAGVYAQMIRQVREAVCDYGTGVRDGNIIVAGPGCELPEQGPLADGRLTMEEARAVFYATAKARPVEEQPWDGPRCEAAACFTDGLVIYSTVPVPFDTLPEEIPLYYYVGYGQIGEGTLQPAIDVLLGDAPIPARPNEDAFFDLDTSLRQTLDG